MKKIITAVISVLLCWSTAIAQTEHWSLVSIKDTSGIIAGYILHTYSMGTKHSVESEKSITGLRFICSKKNNAESLIVIFWNDSENQKLSNTLVKIKIDGKPLQPTMWKQEGNLIYKPIKESKLLMEAIKTSSIVEFEWQDFYSKKTTIFSTRLLNKNLKDFNNVCR